MIIAPFPRNVNRFRAKKSDYFDLDRQMLLISPFFRGFHEAFGVGCKTDVFRILFFSCRRGKGVVFVWLWVSVYFIGFY